MQQILNAILAITNFFCSPQKQRMWSFFLMLLQIFSHINLYHLSLVKNAQSGKDNANTKPLSVKMFESACFGMMKKLLLYWSLSGNALAETRTLFLICAWKIKLNLLQSTLVGVYLSETTSFFMRKLQV